MMENIRIAALWAAWVISWCFLLVGTGFVVKIAAKLFYLGWSLL